ncbi:hypothetical protein [Leptolyngbya sp. 7M]|nr:hypothetical protein [Leptolyngbya sp. 7M]QYO66752.1 hypothetical protein JVX88_08085 [Leptolyngbya sp. 7M]
MCRTYAECAANPHGPATVLLNLSSELMRLYPVILRISLFLQRLVQ